MFTRRSMFAVATTVFVLTLGLPAQMGAAPKKPKFDRVEGWVEMISTERSKISLRISPDIPRFVFYDDKTAFTYRNQPASFDEVKVGRRVICLGKFDEKGRLYAERIDVRVKN